ncbi:MAG: type II toxin-antitoxin system mRNA interferase toxin, RelE/StbE family [Candidatus Paceibacterota bacterium]|jgi:addiction module RelE/StbE family toxin
MELHYSSLFKKQYKKMPVKIREQFKTRLVLFVQDQNNPQLHIHKLNGSYDGLWSMNITGDFRAVFDRIHDSAILFEAIGTHSELYS